MVRKLKWGMIGGGEGSLFGDAHRRAARISDKFELVGGVFSSNLQKNKMSAAMYGIAAERCYNSIEQLIEKELSLPENQRIKVVSIVTPNYLHYSNAKVLLENGFHVICEKPITISVVEAVNLESVVLKSGLVFCVMHTYAGYPMVRQMRELIKQGVVGTIQRVDVQYYQGWVNPAIHGKDAALNMWRLNPLQAGISSCMADIGVHAFNLVEYTTGLKVRKILSDLSTISPRVTLDLDGTVLLQFDTNAKGVLRASQVANGEENNITLAVYGSSGSLKWEQENPNRLVQIAHNEPAIIYKPGNKYNTEFAENSHTMPFGHPEGIYEALANLFSGTARAILGEPYYDGEFQGIEAGVRGMKFIEAAVESNKKSNSWVEL
jgi:predicted dehydrogenase